MKKIFYLLAITAFVFTSCNPLEDINAEVDALTANDALIGDVSRTLSDEDYETLDLSYGNFS
ncbi:MAG: putative small secreted protein, partial [Polaribacter sp.]